MNIIKYKDGYKYQLAETYSTKIGIFPDAHVRHDFILSLIHI